MVNMMMDILQYVPYALFAGAIFLLLLIFTAATINHFRKAERKTAKQISKNMNKIILQKISTLMLLVGALCLTAFSQETTSGTDKMSGVKKDSMEMAKIVSPADAAKNALNVGAQMPQFNLKDANGKSVDSADLLKQGNLVVVFYRGSWCPFCNLYLRNLQKNITQIKAAGGNVVAISVENPDNSLAVSKKNELAFTVLSDPNLTVAKQFGIVYDFPKETDELYKSKGLDISKHNEMDKPQLPLSATYVVNKNGEIVYAFLEPDYKKRAAPETIIETLSKIKLTAPKK